jgi:hypothetical protein
MFALAAAGAVLHGRRRVKTSGVAGIPADAP